MVKPDAQIIRRMAAAIRECLDVQARDGYVDFNDVCETIVPEFGDEGIPHSDELTGLWTFAGQYFHQLEHGDKKMGLWSWDEAKKILTDSLEQVEHGEPITSPIILRFGQPVPIFPFTAINWLHGILKRRP